MIKEKENKRESKLFFNTIVLSIGTFIPSFTSLITLPILTGYLSQIEYGQFDLITVLVALYLPAFSLQIQTAAFRFLIDEREKKENIKEIITSIFVFIVCVSIIALIILYVVLYKYDRILRFLVCVYFFFDIIKQGLLQVVRGLSQNKDYSISTILYSIVNMILIIVLVLYANMGICGAVLALIFSSISAIIYLYIKAEIYQYIRLNNFSTRKLKELLLYSWPMVPNNLSMWVMRASDRFVITMFLGASANAVYAVSNKIPNILSQLQNTITLAWQENASIYSKDEDIELYYSAMFDFFFSFIAGALGLLIAVTPLLFKLLIRGNYEEAYTQMPLLFAGMFFSCMSSYLGGIYVAYKATKNVGITTSLAAVCNLLVDFAMISWAGLYAASISTLISYVVLFLYRLYDIRRLVNIKYKYRKMIAIIMLLGIECALSYYSCTITIVMNLFLAFVVFWLFNRKYISKILSKCLKKVKSL